MTDQEKIEKLERALRPFIVFAQDCKGVKPDAVVVRSNLNGNLVLYAADFQDAAKLFNEAKS